MQITTLTNADVVIRGVTEAHFTQVSELENAADYAERLIGDTVPEAMETAEELQSALAALAAFDDRNRTRKALAEAVEKAREAHKENVTRLENAMRIRAIVGNRDRVAGIGFRQYRTFDTLGKRADIYAWLVANTHFDAQGQRVLNIAPTLVVPFKPVEELVVTMPSALRTGKVEAETEAVTE